MYRHQPDGGGAGRRRCPRAIAPCDSAENDLEEPVPCQVTQTERGCERTPVGPDPTHRTRERDRLHRAEDGPGRWRPDRCRLLPVRRDRVADGQRVPPGATVLEVGFQADLAGLEALELLQYGLETTRELVGIDLAGLSQLQVDGPQPPVSGGERRLKPQRVLEWRSRFLVAIQIHERRAHEELAERGLGINLRELGEHLQRCCEAAGVSIEDSQAMERMRVRGIQLERLLEVPLGDREIRVEEIERGDPLVHPGRDPPGVAFRQAIEILVRLAVLILLEPGDPFLHRQDRILDRVLVSVGRLERTRQDRILDRVLVSVGRPERDKGEEP